MHGTAHVCAMANQHRQLSPCKSSAVFAVLVSRQYMEMSRIRIEGLLAAFPKLVGTGKQHTYVETENVRYVYQPMEVRTAGKGRPCMGATPCTLLNPLQEHQH